jgi:hypothetical protein
MSGIQQLNRDTVDRCDIFLEFLHVALIDIIAKWGIDMTYRIIAAIAAVAN